MFLYFVYCFATIFFLLLVFCSVSLFYISIFLINLKREIIVNQKKIDIDSKETWDYKFEREMNKNIKQILDKDDGIL